MSLRSHDSEPGSLLSYRPALNSAPLKPSSSFLAQLINPLESNSPTNTTTHTPPAISAILKHSSLSTDSTCSLSPTTTTSDPSSSPNHAAAAASLLFSPIARKPSNDDRSEIVYTPDSLESFIHSSNSSSFSNLKDFEDLVAAPATAHTDQLLADLEADQEIELINNETLAAGLDTASGDSSETALILDKIKKISQLQEKINDINSKIERIDMSDAGSAPDLRYYINPKYCGDDEEEEEVDKCLGEGFRAANNQTAFGIRPVEEEENEETDVFVVKSSRRKEFFEEEEDDEFYDDDDDEDEDDLVFGDGYTSQYKQALPVGKKYASTGFLCHRFGGYLAPIEESQDEPPLQAADRQMRATSSCYDLLAGRISNEKLCFSRTRVVEGEEEVAVAGGVKVWEACERAECSEAGLNEPAGYSVNRTSLGEFCVCCTVSLRCVIV